MASGAKKNRLEAVPDERPETGEADGARRGLKPGKRRTSFVITDYWDDKVKHEAARQSTTRSQIYARAIAEYFDNHYGGGLDTLDAADDDLYDPQKFYTASQDKKGHSFHLRVNIPKPLAGEALSFVQSGRVPAYRSVEDIARDAFVHRIKQVSMWADDGELEMAVDLAMLNIEELAIMDREQQAEELLDNIRANVQRMRSRGEDEAMRRYLSEREGLADTIPSPWREDLLEIVRDERKRLGRREKRRR